MGFMIDADIVLHGGNVITGDEKKPRAQGVAVKDGRILWVGTNEGVKQAVGRGTQVRDLKGMTLVPGFIESHNHTLMFGLGLSSIDLTKVGSISNITLLRLGTETQLFALPCWLRGSSIFMLKPTLSNFDQETMDQIDKFFKFGVLPVALELGTEFNFWGVIVGDGLGVNLTPLISAAQADAVNLDFAKVTYYDIYVGNGPWRVSYTAAFDPGASASAYGNRADKTKTIESPSDAMTYLRYIQTLKVSYTF